MSRKYSILLAALAALVLCSSAGAANLTVVTPGLGPGTQLPNCPNGCKLRVTMTGDTVKAFVTDTSPTAERVYRFAFFIKVNNLVFPDKAAITIIEAKKDAPGAKTLAKVSFQFINGKHRIKVFTFDDQNMRVKAGQFEISPSLKQFIEVELGLASAESSNDGFIRMKKGTKVKAATGIDNFEGGTNGVDRLQFGYFKAGNAAIVGPFDLDDFSSFRTLAPLE